MYTFLALSLLGSHGVGVVLALLSLMAIVGVAWILNEPEVLRLIALGFVNATGQLNVTARIVAKTAAYQVLASDGSGTIFTNRGAVGAVTFTLPAVQAQLAGLTFRFRSVVGQNMTVAGAAGTVVTFNNAAATSVTTSTAGALIGTELEAVCDGTSWLVTGRAVGVTYTVA